MKQCPVCDSPLKGHFEMTSADLPDQHLLSCPRCGRLALSQAALMVAEMADAEEKCAAAVWIDAQRAGGNRAGLSLDASRFLGG
jgi:hypothetical protein